MNDDREQIRMKLESRERVERMKNGGEDMRATLATQEIQRGNTSGNDFMSRREEELRNNVQNSKSDPYSGYGEDQRAMMASWDNKNSSREDLRKYSEEELQLREETLSRTPADHDPKYRIIGEAYAPTPQGMRAVGDDAREQHSVYSDEMKNNQSQPHKVRIMDSDSDSPNSNHNMTQKARDMSGKTMQRAKDMGNMVENKARDMDKAHVVEHSAHKAGNTIGSIFSRAKTAARELSDGFREGYSKDNKK